MRSTTRGASTHFAPEGRAGIFTESVGVPGTSMLNAMCLPSGDQERFEGERSSLVNCDSPGASNHLTKTCAPAGCPCATYATRRESGDQAACEPFAKKRLRPPSASIIHTSSSYLSLTLSAQRRV